MSSPIVLSNVDAYLEDSRLIDSAGYMPPLILQPKFGFVPMQFNPGFPDIRDVTDLRPSQNGTFDFTTYFGARAVTLQVGLAEELQDDPNVTDQDLEDRLRQWMLPDARPYLYIRFNSRDQYRRVRLRAANVGSALAFVSKSDFRTVSMSWKGVDGIFENGTLETDNMMPGVSVELGRGYDMAYDRAYAASNVIGSKVFVNSGNAPVFPSIRIYGPCTQPRIENITTGHKLEFVSTFVLNAGEYLLLDCKEGDVWMNGDTNNSRYQFLDFAAGVSEWWSLIPGPNLLRYYPLTSTPPSQTVVDWRSGYL